VTSAAYEQKMPKESGIDVAVSTCELFLCFGAIALLGYIVSCFSEVLMVLCLTILLYIEDHNTEDEPESHGE